MDKSKELSKQKMMLEYAWNWFSYHAKQRLTTFNFFLVIIGAIGFLFIQMIDKSEWLKFQNTIVFSICGVFLIIVSKLFHKIEHRNHELVNCGREALDRLEKEIGMYNEKADNKNFSVRLRDEKRQCLPEGIIKQVSHTQVFKTIFTGVQVIGALMIILGLVCAGFTWICEL